MAVTTKMSVDVSGFKAGIQQAQNSVRTLDAELKRNEAQFKATGDKEKYMESQTKALNSRIAEQQKVVKNAENALKSMEQSGVKPTDAAYQQMQRTLLNAQTAIAQTTVQMDALNQSEQKAAGSAEKMTDSLASIGKKVNLDAVISGVNSITKGLEDAAKAAVSFARDAWGEIMEVAGYADDIATKAMIYGMTAEEYQSMANLAATWGEVSVEDIMTARRRMWKNGRSFAEEGVFAEMGINPYTGSSGKFGSTQMKGWEDLFWESGAALMGMDEFSRAEYGEKLFGRSWERLMPMFTMGRAEYEKQLGIAMESVISNEDIESLAPLNDIVTTLGQKLTALEGTVLAKLAPALTEAANAVGLFLDKLIEFLGTERGQELLDRMAEAVTGLFEDLSKIDPEQVVEGFVGVFEKLIEGLEWLWEHKTDIGNALLTILEIWGTAKIGGTLLEIIKLVDGVKYLLGGGAAKATGGLLSKLGVGEALKGAAGAAMPFLLTDAAVVGLAALPAIIAQHEDEKRWMADRERRLEAAEGAGDNADFVRIMANALGPETDSAGNYVRNMFGFLNMRPTDTTYDMLMGLEGRQNAERAKMMSLIRMYAPATEGRSTEQLLQDFWAGEEIDPGVVTALAQNVTDALSHDPVWISNFEVPPEAGADIAEQIGEVPVAVRPYVPGAYSAPPGDTHGGIGGGGPGSSTYYSMHANGLPFVPNDGYLAVLHRGERVMTAAENRHYTYNSNNYFGNVNLNNGLEIEALTASIDRHNRRQRAGFGA